MKAESADGHQSEMRLIDQPGLSKDRKLRIAVVLVNYNGLSDTMECLDSMRTLLDDNTFAIVVDNASASDCIEEMIAAFPDVHLIRNSTNQGWAGGNNRGIELALHQGADWVMLLNNDTIVSAAIFERLRTAIGLGVYDILGVVINEFDDRNRVQTEGVRFNPDCFPEFFQTIATPITKTDPPTISQVDIVNGCAVMISKNVFEKIGMIDERFFLICEESDFCLRAQANGFKAGVLHETHVWHKHSVSFARSGKPLQRYYGTRNLGLLLAKHWGGIGRKGFWASFGSYFRHAYHLFCYEWEMNNKAGAEAVMMGLRDAMFRRFGNQPMRTSLTAKGLMFFAAGLWRLRGGHLQGGSQQKAESHS